MRGRGPRPLLPLSVVPRRAGRHALSVEAVVQGAQRGLLLVVDVAEGGGVLAEVLQEGGAEGGGEGTPGDIRGLHPTHPLVGVL